MEKYKDVDIKLLAQNDPYQLELTEESVLLDYFTKYLTKDNKVNESAFSEDTEQTRQTKEEPAEVKDIVKIQLSRQITHFSRIYNPHTSVLDFD